MPAKKKNVSAKKNKSTARKTASAGKSQKSRVAKSVSRESRMMKKVARPEKKLGDREPNKSPWRVLRGMRDILPKQEKYWRTVFDQLSGAAEFFHFGRIDTPILEEAKLFLRTLGKTSDVVTKEMYMFDIDEGRVCLRPEATASVARAYISAGLWNQPQPSKLWYWGPMFRHDRPQAGRYRQFYQAGFEIIGANDPVMDAELILVGYNLFKDLGLPVTVKINSIGLPEEREKYVSELTSYYRAKRAYLCENCRKRLAKNPLRLLDCKEAQCQPIKDEAPQILDWLTESSKNYFMKVLEALDELEIPYVLKSDLVRGLDYYTHTVFEITPAFEGEADEKLRQMSETSLCGGGRYDLLIQNMSGRETPASGMAIGVDRVILALKEYGKAHSISIAESKVDIFFAQLGDRAKSKALKMIDALRRSGVRVGFNLYKDSLKAQLELANNLAVPFALILGQKEVQDGTIIVRDMESGIQEIVDQKKVENLIKKKLSAIDKND